MDDLLKKEAFQFMYAQFGKSIWWQSPSLTRAGNPKADPPTPDLNQAQADSIFRELIDKELLFPTINPSGQYCWLIHQGKKSEWEALINPPNFLQKNWKPCLYYVGAFLLWSSSLIYSTWLVKAVDDRLDERDKQPPIPTAPQEQKAVDK